jgi:hypothetical protein
MLDVYRNVYHHIPEAEMTRIAILTSGLFRWACLDRLMSLFLRALAYAGKHW